MLYPTELQAHFVTALPRCVVALAAIELMSQLKKSLDKGVIHWRWQSLPKTLNDLDRRCFFFGRYPIMADSRSREANILG